MSANCFVSEFMSVLISFNERASPTGEFSSEE